MNNISYEYMNETSINPELVCTICNDPLNDPFCTPCDHTFCRECITGWINGGSLSCPMCRQHLESANDLVQANRTVRNMLDHLPVMCILCGKTELQRCNFNEHMGRVCSKVCVPCPSADIKCPWKGPRDQLNDHIATCVFHPFRTLVTELMAENRQLKEQIKQLSDTINTRLKSEITMDKKTPCENCRNCLYLQGASGDYPHTSAREGYYRAFTNSYQGFYHIAIGVCVLKHPCVCNCHRT